MWRTPFLYIYNIIGYILSELGISRRDGNRLAQGLYTIALYPMNHTVQSYTVILSRISPTDLHESLNSNDLS